jgi:hypothetical protein
MSKVLFLSPRRFGILVAATMLLAGCQITDPPSSQSGAPSQQGGSSPNSWRLALFGNPQNVPQERKGEEERQDLNCPTVGVLDGGAAHRLGRPGAASEVAHQASLIDVARECRFSATSIDIKVGVYGRLLIGALGKPGTYSVPVRVAVKRRDAVVASRIARVSVTIPPNETSVAFTHIEENISLPLSERDPSDEYDVYVGFDEGGGPNDPRRGRRRR